MTTIHNPSYTIDDIEAKLNEAEKAISNGEVRDAIEVITELKKMYEI